MNDRVFLDTNVFVYTVFSTRSAQEIRVDLQLLKLASRVSGDPRGPVTDPVHFIEEISQWKH